MFDPSMQQRKLQILCLHGSRQDGEIFSQRIKTLCKKLSSIADLHFVSAPHTLPLQEGQVVPSRAWWRHWNISPDAQPQNSLVNSSDSQPAPASLANQQTCRTPTQQQQEQHVASMMAAGWEAVILQDWAVSLQHLCAVWQAGPPIHGSQQVHIPASNSSSSGSSGVSNSRVPRNSPFGGGDGTSIASPNLVYDGILGFSNGAAAAFLFAAHAAAHLEQFASLQFVALAGGYVAAPLDKLLPAKLLLTQNSNGSNVQQIPSVASCLIKPLPFASLHMMGTNDPLIDVAGSMQLMECFQEHGRVQLLHESGHSVPQQARYMQHILEFMMRVAKLPGTLCHQHKQRLHRLPAAAARGPEALLQKLGLRDKAKKGPAHRQPMIHVDNHKQPHLHHNRFSNRQYAQQHPQQQQQRQDQSQCSKHQQQLDPALQIAAVQQDEHAVGADLERVSSIDAAEPVQ